MDLAGKIIADSNRAAEERLKSDRAARKANLSCDGVMGRRKRARIVEEVPTPRQVISQVLRDEEYVEEAAAEKRGTRRPSLLKRIGTAVRRWWFRAPVHHTHRIITRNEVRFYEEIPRRIEDLYEEDEKGNKIPEGQLPFRKVIVEHGTTVRLITVLFAGALVLELDEGGYIVAGWEHVSRI